MARRLLQRWEDSGGQDWRNWNYGRWRSLHATAANEALLRAAEQSQPPPSRSGAGQGSRGSFIDIPEPDKKP